MKPGKSDSLTRRASLTNVNSMIEQFCRLVAGFVVSPVVMRALGPELYGAWSMIGQIQGYLSLSDLRSGGTLKVLLSAQQHRTDPDEKRRLIGAALVVSWISLSLIAVVGGLLVPFLPRIIHTSPAHVSSVRWAFLLVLVSLAVTQIFTVAGCTLRGSNLDYKSLGLRSGVTVVVSVLGLFAVLLGTGIAGLAAAGLAGAMLTGWMWYALARRYVDWFGVARPSRKDLRAFMGNSVWSMSISVGQLALVNSDILLVGWVLGPKVAGAYASTGALMRFLTAPIGTMIASASPGLGGVCGAREWERAARIARELLALSLLLAVVTGSVVLAVNQSFIHQWVGNDFFAGRRLTVGLVVLAIVQSVFRVASVLVDGVLALRAKGLVLLASGGGGLGLIWIGSRIDSATGMVVAMTVATIAAIAGFGWILRQKTGIPIRSIVVEMARPLATGALLLGVAQWVAPMGLGWPGIVMVAAATGTVSLATMFFLGLDAPVRGRLWKRLPIRRNAAKAGG